MGGYHNEASGDELHMPFRATDTDPTTVGEHHSWWDPDTKTLRIRNATNDGWVVLARPIHVEDESTDAYTLTADDHNAFLRLSDATGVTLTVPPNASVELPVGTLVRFEQAGAGAVEVVEGAGVTVNAATGFTATADQHSVGTLVKVAEDEWTLWGDLEAGSS